MYAFGYKCVFCGCCLLVEFFLCDKVGNLLFSWCNNILTFYKMYLQLRPQTDVKTACINKETENIYYIHCKMLVDLWFLLQQCSDIFETEHDI